MAEILTIFLGNLTKVNLHRQTQYHVLTPVDRGCPDLNLDFFLGGSDEAPGSSPLTGSWGEKDKTAIVLSFKTKLKIQYVPYYPY